jgi:hypothetical protein
LEKREGRRNVFPKAPSIQQENYPQVSPGYPSFAYELSSDELKDKVAYITFTLQVSKGSGPGTLTYRESIRTFEEGDPQQWMEVITGLKEIWAQNSIMVLMDMSNTAMAILKGDSLTSYETAMEDNRTNPDDESLRVPMTEQHIDNALLAVTSQIFPYCALETLKQWMSKYARKLLEVAVLRSKRNLLRIQSPQRLHQLYSMSAMVCLSRSSTMGLNHYAVYYQVALTI